MFKKFLVFRREKFHLKTILIFFQLFLFISKLKYRWSIISNVTISLETRKERNNINIMIALFNEMINNLFNK